MEIGAGVFDVLNDGLIAGDFAAAEHVGGDQQLRGVADGKYRFAAADEITGKPHSILIHAQFVGGISCPSQKLNFRHLCEKTSSFSHQI